MPGRLGHGRVPRPPERRLRISVAGSAIGARVWQEPAGGGLIRVRVRWPGGEPDAAAQLAEAGFADAYRVSGAGAVTITGAKRSFKSGSEILLVPAGDWATAVDGRRYRGWFRIRGAGREVLVINELPMEEYLLGVVPVEMGPSQFPELEALKAQAVAARTYAVAHLGDHDEEGWDICATPACQAYHGAGAEHPLSDRAVRETTGLIAVYGGRPIDAMYTSTCGGRTEDAAELFSGRASPYLKGVACAWDRPLLLEGEKSAGPIGDLRAFRRLLARRALELEHRRRRPSQHSALGGRDLRRRGSAAARRACSRRLDRGPLCSGRPR